MKIKNVLVMLVFMLFIVGCGNNNQKDENVLSIGVIQFASHPALDQAYEGFIMSLEELGLKEGEDFVIDLQNAQGDTATAETIADKLVNDKHDLIYAIATPAAQSVANKTKDIPIVVAAVTDPQSSGLVETNEKPNTNVTGVSDLTPVKRQIELLKEIAPDTKKVAIMYANSEDNSRFQADIAKIEIEKLNMEAIDASVSDANQIQQMTESLVGKVDAIYVPTDNLVSESFSVVSNIANEHKIITVVGEIAMVNTGGLITDGITYISVGKQAGNLAHQILIENADIKTLPIVFLADEDLELAINTTTEEKLGIEIAEVLREKAKLVE